jgi:hypothetical protein
VRLRKEIKILEALPTFAAKSAGHTEDRAAMALRPAEATIKQLSDLANLTKNTPLSTIPPVAFAPPSPQSERLAELFRTHGSDKATDHDYHIVYAAILETLTGADAILEVGIGTRNEEVVSAMLGESTPGGRSGRLETTVIQVGSSAPTSTRLFFSKKTGLKPFQSTKPTGSALTG